MVIRAMVMRSVGLMLVTYACMMATDTHGMNGLCDSQGSKRGRGGGSGRGAHDVLSQLQESRIRESRAQESQKQESRVLKFSDGLQATVVVKSAWDPQDGVYFRVSRGAFDALQRDIADIVRQLGDEKKCDADNQAQLVQQVAELTRAHAATEHRLHDLEQQLAREKLSEDDRELLKE